MTRDSPLNIQTGNNGHLVLILSWCEHNWFKEMEAAAAANIGWTGYDITVRKEKNFHSYHHTHNTMRARK